MKRSIETAATVLALTTALAAGTTEAASAEAAHTITPKHARAIALAALITKELYDGDFSKGVVVPGLLNGSVVTDLITVSGEHKGHYRNPIILVERHPRAPTDIHGNYLDGSWLGIPGNDANGHVVITPVHLNLSGERYGETQKLRLRDGHDIVHEDAGVYPTSVTGEPDQLFGFDIQGNGDFPSRHIYSDGMK